MARAKAKPAAQRSLGELCDMVYALKLEEAQIKGQLDEKERERRVLEEQVMEAMDSAETSVIEGSAAHAEISVLTKPQIDDYEAFAAFVIKRKATQLFQRRIHEGALKELREKLGGKPIPGISDFTVRKLNVRKAS